MSLLTDIVEALTRSERPLADVLRMAKVLAVRLGYGDLERWVDSELNGYEREEDLPSYRIMNAIGKGDLFGPFQSAYKNFPIPSLALPEKYQELANSHKEMGGIASIEETLAAFPHGNVRLAWNPNLVLSLQDKILVGYSLLQAWSEMSRHSYVAILDTVRTRLLGLILAVEKENPQAGEPGQAGSAVAPDKLQQIFQTHIYSPSGNIAIGSQDFEQNAAMVARGDFESLRRALLSVGLNEEDITNLREAVDEDGDVDDKAGEKVSRWIGRMVEKASAGTWQVSVAAAGQILGTMLGQYLGIPPA